MKHDFTNRYKNVYVRPLKMEDIELLRVWRNNPKNTKYLRKLQYITPEMQLSWFQKYERDSDEIAFAIEETKELRRMVGSISLYNIQDNRAECGKILVGDEEAHGRRIGCNSLKAVLQIAFNKIYLDEVYLHVYKENKAAVCTYLNAGLVIEEERETLNGLEYVMGLRRNRYA